MKNTDDQEINSALPCERFARAIFTDEFILYLTAEGYSIPEALQVLGVVCKNTSCKHHVYNGIGNSTRYSRPNWESNAGRRIMFCMCCISEPMPVEDIADMYNISVKGVRWTLDSAMAKIRKGVVGQTIDDYI